MKRVNAATWMTDLFPFISKRKLSEIFMPGSHDSAMMFECLSQSLGPIDLDLPTPWGPDAPDSLTKSPLGETIRGVVRNWAVTQKLELLDQLRAGIRYFDLRIANVNGEFKFTHALLSNYGIIKLLQPVVGFMAEHPGEVLILHCQHFHNMNNEYDKLMGVFQSLFGNMLANSDMVQSSQFGDFVSSGKRIVLIWGDGAVGSLTDKTFACDQGTVLDSPWKPEQMRSKELLATFLLTTQRDRPSADPRLSVVQCILDYDDMSSKPWEYMIHSSLLEYENGLNSYLKEVVLPELGKSKGFIFMMDNVTNPDTQAIERIITLNDDIGNGLQGFDDLVKNRGANGSKVESLKGVRKHIVGFSGNPAYLGPNAHFVGSDGSMSFSAQHGSVVSRQSGVLRFPPNDSIHGIILGIEVYDVWQEGNTGSWRLPKNPLGQPNVEVEVSSEIGRGTFWELGVWYLDTSGGQGIKPVVSNTGLDGSWVESRKGIQYYDVGFSGDRALLGNNVRSVRAQGSMSFSAQHGSVFEHRKGTLRFPPDTSMYGLILSIRVHDIWGDGTNGSWKFTGNPLGQTSMEVQITSDLARGTNWELEVWYLPLQPPSGNL